MVNTSNYTSIRYGENRPPQYDVYLFPADEFEFIQGKNSDKGYLIIAKKSAYEQMKKEHEQRFDANTNTKFWDTTEFGSHKFPKDRYDLSEDERHFILNKKGLHRVVAGAQERKDSTDLKDGYWVENGILRFTGDGLDHNPNQERNHLIREWK